MNLIEGAYQDAERWSRVRDSYGVTKKPRSLDLHEYVDIPFVPMELVPQGGAYEPAFLLRKIEAIASGTYFEKGNLLVSKITPSFENGKQALALSFPYEFGYASTEIVPLHPLDQEQDPRLLFFYLLHPEVRHYIAERMEGSTGRQRVPEGVLLDLPIPKLDGHDQSRIADALEMIQAAIAVEGGAAESTRLLKEASMRELFASGLRGESQKETEIGLIPASWEPRRIHELCEIWSGGTPRKSVLDYWSGDIPWVSGKDLKRPALEDAIDHVSSSGVREGSRLAPEGAVLLLVRGMGLAKDLPVAVIKRPMAFNQDVKALVSRGQYSGRFLRSAIYAGKKRLLNQIVPSAHGTMTLNLNDVENFTVACPSDSDEANEIANILDGLETKIDLHKRKRDVLKELFNALLDKLMTGEVDVNELDLSSLNAEVKQ